jgi:pimeloyl-ACP methyl ester carboxylesterase
LPGFGESDPPPDGVPSLRYAEAARVISSLAAELRLRRIDLFGVGFGAAVALELGAARADLVRRLVLMRVPPMDRIPTVKQESLVLSADLLDTAPEDLARQISAFLETKIGGMREAQ